MKNAIETQMVNVTTLILVTPLIPVTPETVLLQLLSPLSPLSPLFILAIHARDKGLGMTYVTSDVVTLVTRAGSKSGTEGADTVQGQKRTFLQIDVLKQSICNVAFDRRAVANSTSRERTPHG